MVISASPVIAHLPNLATEPAVITAICSKLKSMDMNFHRYIPFSCLFSCLPSHRSFLSEPFGAKLVLILQNYRSFYSPDRWFRQFPLAHCDKTSGLLCHFSRPTLQDSLAFKLIISHPEGRYSLISAAIISNSGTSFFTHAFPN